ncbi:bifunctional 23S rRNA (guanine(2069)-N(7))-methyltransferase RlmK/23S rRNA (guanine(2445)-N(2))-methyltransferase RlmL [Saccharobesus litoralis]|uniref:Ribosomal RNA large subunit methyltransferase K/L n=1 Tax=Saccharobesus litoralis TaxID=2172099 RepID=A0A2S0VTS3_9ALTE|nr:bifunctional 23S rRNA (guanine(2069)-N(7))-methyltransferase RlmK/23S rRNA (guanine(2445)-N(2))-methyltransferase RlmL [Saccharobesus litoralis]AWB67618.1 bifunctional 23S rRNA (guanine(2069)-N(7))-methyltransferase RlmK/23S rRNA (guanine(2445)-N(2))-methyltransferase RlmL [Saccharobesus litoralis]
MAKFLVTTSKGLENLLFTELENLGATDLKMSVSSVWCQGDLAFGYKVAYLSRLANRVLLELAVGDCQNKDDLYRITSSVDWTMQFSNKKRFSVDFVGTNKALRNTQFSAQVMKDAIVDAFVEEGSKRPDVDKQMYDIRFHGRIIKQQVHVFLDFSGSSLHERGYREKAGKAPLKENLAAGLVLRSGWLNDTTKPLCDFFCGSGTIVIEAAQMARNIPAQHDRVRWGFDSWLSHNQNQFEQIKQQAEAQIDNEITLQIFASDISKHELGTAQRNADLAHVSQDIQFTQADALSPKVKNFFRETGTIIINPPYGERLDETAQVANLYLDLGQKFKKEFTDWQLTAITSAENLLRLFKLSASKKYKVKNGPLDCVVANYQIEAAKGEQVRGVIAEEFQNRLKKNAKKLAPLAKKAETNCYRVYDADLPNYNVAVDLYSDHLVIQEYAAPKSVPEHVAAQRLNDVLITAPAVLEIDPKNIHVKTRSKQKGKEQYQRSTHMRDIRIVVEEGKAKFLVNLDDYLDTGLFLDHRNIRYQIGELAKDKRVLNLFSYTCSVSVHAALGGAKQITSVDLSKTYLNWGKDNFDLNKLSTRYHKFEQADCMQWFMQQSGQYDLIFIDPPSFSNSKRMKDVFDVQRDHIALLTQAYKCLATNGTLIFSNNLRSFKLDEDAVLELGFDIKNISESSLPFDFSRNAKIRQCWLLTKTH